MSSKPFIDYLTKEVTINLNIISYRLLSRHFSIHVNTAKEELHHYHKITCESQNVYATYLISGEKMPTQRSTQSTEDTMDIDGESWEDDGEDTPIYTMTLVSEKDLESVKATFQKINFCHVYCLSPSPLIDADLACEPNRLVLEIDKTKGQEFHKTVGRVISPEIKHSGPISKGKAPASTGLKTSKPSASSATHISAPTVASASRIPAVSPKAKVEESESAQKSPAAATSGPKKFTSASTLNWSKAKVKTSAAAVPVKQEPPAAGESSTSAQTAVDKDASAKTKEDVALKLQRGAKRKSDAMMQQPVEDPPSKPPSKGPVVKNGRILSDDEDDDMGSTKAKSTLKEKQKAAAPDLDDLETERSLRAMMDIDDSDVIRVPRKPELPKNAAEKAVEEERVVSNAMDIDEVPEEDVDKAEANEMDEDSDPVPKVKPRKRKPKKVIPVGRNGLKKKRVVKSRMTTDEKGYMVTEDYSEYESVEEEEAEGDPSMKSKSEGKEAAKTDKLQRAGASKDVKMEEKKSIKPLGARKASTGGSGGGKKNLMNYFGGTTKN